MRKDHDPPLFLTFYTSQYRQDLMPSRICLCRRGKQIDDDRGTISLQKVSTGDLLPSVAVVGYASFAIVGNISYKILNLKN